MKRAFSDNHVSLNNSSGTSESRSVSTNHHLHYVGHPPHPQHPQMQRCTSADARGFQRHSRNQSSSEWMKRKSGSSNNTVIHHPNGMGQRRENPFKVPSLENREELKALSPSSGGMTDMYGTPSPNPSPDGDGVIGRQLTSGMDPVMIACVLEPPPQDEDLNKFSVDLTGSLPPTARTRPSRHVMRPSLDNDIETEAFVD